MVEYVALANLKGPQGDVTPAALEALADARAARDEAGQHEQRAEQARDAAEAFSGQAEELQDEAVATLLAGPSDSRLQADAASRVLLEHVAVGTPRVADAWAGFRQTIMSPTTPCRVVFVGSSTWRAGSAQYIGAVERLAFLAGASSVAELDTATSAPSTGMHFFNGAVGGVASNAYLPEARLAKIDTVSPRYVFHGVGSNDWAGTWQTPLETYKSNIRQALERIEADTAYAVNVLIHQQRRADQVDRVISWDAYGQALAELAAEKPARRIFLNLDEMLDTYVLDRPSNSYGLVHADDVHPSHYGHKVIAETIARRVGIPVPPMQSPVEYRYTVPASQSYTAASTRLATHQVAAVAFPRFISFDMSAFVRTAGTGAKTLQVYLRGDGYQARVQEVVGDHSVSMSGFFYVPPGFSGELAFNAAVGGGSIYVSGGETFTWLRVTETPC